MQRGSKILCALAVAWSSLFSIAALVLPVMLNHGFGSSPFTGIAWGVVAATFVPPVLAALAWYLLVRGKHLAVSIIVGILGGAALGCMLAVFVTPAVVFAVDLAFTAIFLLAARLNEKTARDLKAARSSTPTAP